MRLKDAERVLHVLKQGVTNDRWHNLKKYPDDLPPIDSTWADRETGELIRFSKTVLAVVEVGDSDWSDRYHAIAYMNLSDEDWYDKRTQNLLLGNDERVIGWMLIPPFIEVEEEEDA